MSCLCFLCRRTRRHPARDADQPFGIDPIRFERALARLPWLEREALLLRTRDGLSYAEIGAVLGLTPEAAEARVVMALIKLDVRLRRPDQPWWRFWR